MLELSQSGGQELMQIRDHTYQVHVGTGKIFWTDVLKKSKVQLDNR